jgi:protein-S-isoprenylcysteine O-methyltransferase Ste14
MAFGFFFVLMLPVIDLWRFTSPRQPWRFRVLVVECCVAGLLAAIGVAFEWFPWFNLALLAAVAVNLLFIWMRQRALIRNKAVFTELTVGFNMLCGLLLIGAYRSGLRPQDAGPRSVGDYFMLFALVVLGAIVGGNLWLQRSHKHDVVRSEASTTAVLTLGFVVLGFQMLQASLHLQSWLLPWVNTRFFDVALLRWIGEAVMVAALLLLAWSYRKMGGSWRIGIDTETPGALVVSGAFGWSRNPIYLAVDLFMVGYFLLNPTLSGVLFVLSTPIFLHAQILREEAFLADAYGAEYAEYAAKSPRYL